MTVYSPVNVEKFILLFSILMSYSFFKKIINKIEELSKEKFITHLRAINISSFRIFIKHILPTVTLPLFANLITSITFIVSFEFIVSITDIVSPFKNAPSIGSIGYDAIIDNNYMLISTILIFFLFLMLELNFLVYNIKEVLNNLEGINE